MRTKLLLRILTLSLALVPAALTAAEQGDFYLHSGDTVVFYGDSITDQRLYTMLTELYVVTRFPGMNVGFVHSGWGGDRVTGGGGGSIDQRLQRDVFPYHPTVLTIMLGMNDGRYVNHTAADDDVYYTGYRHIIDAVRQAIPNLRITAIEPSPYDDVTRPLTLQPAGYNAILVSYGEWIRRYATQAKLDVADLNAGVVEMLRKANVIDPAMAQKIIPDRVHPGLAGHLIMAEQLLKAWGARSIVSDVKIDAMTGDIAQAEFAHVSDVHAGVPLSWSEQDEALPLPLAEMMAADHDHTIGLAIRASDVVQALNEQELRVTGLKAGDYKLTIDGEPVGTWKNTELEQGVNLAVLETPMSEQAMQVRDLTVRRIDIHQSRWRTLQVPLQGMDLEHLNESLRALDSLDIEVAAKQRAAAQPRSHVFQLTPTT